MHTGGQKRQQHHAIDAPGRAEIGSGSFASWRAFPLVAALAVRCGPRKRLHHGSCDNAARGLQLCGQSLYTLGCSCPQVLAGIAHMGEACMAALGGALAWIWQRQPSAAAWRKEQQDEGRSPTGAACTQPGRNTRPHPHQVRDRHMTTGRQWDGKTARTRPRRLGPEDAVVAHLADASMLYAFSVSQTLRLVACKRSEGTAGMLLSFKAWGINFRQP